VFLFGPLPDLRTEKVIAGDIHQETPVFSFSSPVRTTVILPYRSQVLNSIPDSQENIDQEWEFTFWWTRQDSNLHLRAAIETAACRVPYTTGPSNIV
jgi:hypothetical protein